VIPERNYRNGIVLKENHENKAIEKERCKQCFPKGTFVAES